ncbi:uncharacterized protein LOC133462171 [Cololabis saira]|uniref:uncharacterized protein LOC133462171 n=1 Tax=Cololabis saira TaxID=129043 RepID=UPI002AD56E16|nr:uncharacterized protein LOC133462171 [Cololabis saira]
MDSNRQQTVFTNFIRPFLSRNDSSDPGCISSVNGSQEWLQKNLGIFSAFASLQDLEELYPNVSANLSLSELTPSQVAQLLLSSGSSNDTELIDQVFERLEDGDALENVDEFLTQLPVNGQIPQFQPVVRDVIMNRTFLIISTRFPTFKQRDFYVWFNVKLASILASFTPQMLTIATSSVNCTTYHVVVSGLARVFPDIPLHRQQGITDALLDYLTTSVSVINKPDCRQGMQTDAEWLETNLGPFAQYVSYTDLKIFNLSQETVVGVLTPQQKAELILDPDSGALENATLVRVVLTNLTQSGNNRTLNQFFQAFTENIKQKNITFITNPAVQDTILNLTLTALAPKFGDFGPEEFQLWFQIYLVPVIPSLHPDNLRVIPRSISCESYTAILTGLNESLEFLPLNLSMGVRSSIRFLKNRFPRCSVPDSFVCKETPVDEDLICAAVNRSQLQQALAIDNSSSVLCNFTITQHACSLATHLTQNKLATLLKCSLESQTTYPVEIWKLFFQKTSPALDRALETFTTTAPNNSSPALSNALEALGEVKLANFSQAQLQNEDFISNWFQKTIQPFLSSPSTNFLSCLSTKNFSCLTYQIVIKEFSNQRPFMDSNRQQTVFTNFIRPFLSRNDSSDPGCISSVNGSQEWLQKNLGIFSAFASLQDLEALYPNVSANLSLSELTPSQVAQLLLSSGSSNDTELIDQVFERLEDGDALENVDEFLTQLPVNGQIPQFQPVVRDVIMNRTFLIISTRFPTFKQRDFYVWFNVKLASILASFTPQMLTIATSSVNCTTYHVVVSGLARVFPDIPLHRQQGITDALLDYLTTSVSVINKPDCRQGMQTDAEWLETNLGPFAQYVSYTDLKIFNLSQETVVGVLTPQQKAELILDPDSGALENATLVRVVLTNLTQSGNNRTLNQFFQAFTENIKQKNITFITNPAVQDTILNLTLTALAPKFGDFGPEEFQLWFQIYLVPVIPSLHPDNLRVIPRSISCESYTAILTGLNESLEFLPLNLSMGVRSSIRFLKNRFPRCSVPDSFVCKETPVDEDLICAAVNRSQLQQALAIDNSSSVLCNFTITQHACSLATHLTQNKLATLLKCSLESQTTYPVEIWKLFFQKTSPALDRALETFTTTAPNNSSPALSNALEALGEVKLANFSQAQLQNEDFISNWFQKTIQPFLSSPSTNFLSCLSTKNFSCLTYQIVIKEFSNQRPFMDSNRQQTVFTNFIRPFLSRNDSSDPGCISSVNGSQEWLQKNLGIFSAFASLQDLEALYPNVSANLSLSELTPSQVAQLLLSSGSSNDTELIDQVFERLEDGDALENVDEFLTQLPVNGQIPQFQPVVRDVIMNRTFLIISTRFPTFKQRDFYVWFNVKLASILASFTPQMLTIATSSVNCTTYHVVVSGLARVFPDIPLHRQQGITDALLDYLTTSVSVINKPDCRQGMQTDAEWLETNLGPFAQYVSYTDLKIFNLSQETCVGVLTPQQKAELILDPDSGALENATLVRVVLTNLTQSGNNRTLNQFFQAFTENIKQKNITFITNPAVQDTILNLTLTALAPKFGDFGPEEFQLWFQIYLVPVIPSLHPDNLRVIPRSISCESYTAILTGLNESLEFLPLNLSMGVRSSIRFLKNRFPRCSVPDSFVCKETPVDEDLICAAVNRSQLQQALAIDNSSSVLCNFTITQHACSLATHLTQNKLATLLKCSLESQTTYPVEIWKLFFQKTSPALDRALETFTTTAPNNSSPALSNALEALGEVKLANFSQAQLQNEDFISNWFQKTIQPFLSSPSTNFLSCLSTKNFSCLTYQIVIKEFSNQRPFMDSNRQQTVFTNFIRPFLSRNDSSDPGCISSVNGSQEWLQKNLGIFSAFASLQDLEALYPNVSANLSLSELTPSQVAQLLLSSGSSNDTELIDQVFERLEDGDALENVDEFLTQLPVNGQIPQFQPVVRDVIMNRTFLIISTRFPTFKQRDFYVWFNVKLASILASFTPQMLTIATSSVNCTTYHVVVSGLARVFPDIPLHRQQGITDALLDYLTTSVSVINKPDCRQGMQTDAEWLGTNLGPFAQYVSYTDLKIFNLSQETVVGVLTPQQKAELILDPDSGALENATLVRVVLTNLTQSGNNRTLNQFFQAFTENIKQKNITFITNPAVQDTILNLTLTALAPKFGDFGPEEFQLWFQIYLVPVIPSLHPDNLRVIPRSISCESYTAILTGLKESLEFLPLNLSMGVRSSIRFLKNRFPRCSVPDSFVCKETPVDEDLICAAVNRSQLQQALPIDNSSSVLCNFTITQHACSLATHLPQNKLATLLKCSLESQTTYPVEIWKLFFQKTSPALDRALETFTTTAPNNSSPALSNALEALGEVKLANFSQAQLQNEDFISNWFQKTIQPFLSSPSTNFLSCLSTKNFSCLTYQIVIKEFSNQRPFMDSNRQQTVFTNFIRPFLSRNDSSDPGCISSVNGSQEWLQKNLGIFSAFASLQDLEALYPNVSANLSLSELTPSQVAQLLLSSGSSNDTELIDQVFERLEDGDALENVDEFLTQLPVNGQIPQFQPVVRDVIMNRTFLIISTRFPTFKQRDFYVWFNVKLASILASFTPQMLMIATSSVNCTTYHVVVSGLARVFPDIPLHRQQGITDALLDYLTTSASVINKPDCRQGMQTDAEWLETNLGPFAQYVSYTDLKIFNLSQVTILDSISSEEKAKFLLEPNNLSNETLVILVFSKLTASSSLESLETFFETFVDDAAVQNLTAVNPTLSYTILNLTLLALGPELSLLKAEGFKSWFQVYLIPFLPSVDSHIFKMIPKNITCKSYREIVTGFNNVFPKLSANQTQQVSTFALEYLRGQSGSGVSCFESGNDDRSWLKNNFGLFSFQASYPDFLFLKKNFSGVEVADLLTLSQLSQLAGIPSQLKGAEDVTKIMTAISPPDFGAFFDVVSPAIEAQSANYSEEVKSAFLQAVFNRGGLSTSDISDEEFIQWLKVRLRPLLVNLTSGLVTPLFHIGTNRSCNSTQEMITLLDTLHMTLSSNTQKEIYKNILLFLQGPPLLKCWSGGSFYIYLKNNFLSFGFPEVSTFLSLLPSTRKSELLNTISTSELGEFLRQSNMTDNISSFDICTIFSNYNNTAAFLETEDVPDRMKKLILPCVWHLALGSEKGAEVNAWFELRLKNYLSFLNKTLISFPSVQNATCPAFQKLVFYMGNGFTYNNSEIGREDVYTTIRSYLSAGSKVKCYNPNDTDLNSTAWFVNYIGNFVTFLTLDDLTAFVPVSETKGFLENTANLQLISSTSLPENVTNYYISLLFDSNPVFNLSKLPDSLMCSSSIPSSAYSSLNEADAITVLGKLKELCNGTQDPEVTVILASNIQTLTQQTFVNLGDASSTLTISQITSVPSTVLISSLSTLGSVSWGQDQARTIIQSLTSSGFQVESAASLQSLGSLVAGVPSASIEKISASELLKASNNTNFISNMLNSPPVLQQTLVEKIISVDTSPAKVVQNVPDALATEIPPSLLTFSETDVDFSTLNKKTWTSDQSSIFFGNLAGVDFDIEELSPSVLQGFTCTAAQSMSKKRIRRLIRSSRNRRGRAKVALKEPQLTCMYNLLNGELSQNFTDYPPDMLLYFNSEDIQKNNCRSYLSALGAADFTLLSSVLGKRAKLFSEARTCLGINGSSLSKDNVEVLGSMSCTLDGSYIENSDPVILEELKACKDFSDSQVAAMETLLLSGKTQYGNVTTWNQQTLGDLGILPLYFTSNIWGQLKTETKKIFLRGFMPNLRKAKTNKGNLKKLFEQISLILVKRAAGCTAGNITQVTVSDASFPFGYDQTQFDVCLDVSVLKDNLNSICEKVDDNDFQRIILKKLNQAFPSGVPDQEVQMLGSVSRVASLDDISKWNVTEIDTLAALMETEDGTWETAQSKAIITKYLETSGNSLGSSELSTIDSNLCSLNTSTLMTITPESFRNAKLLNVASCSAEQKTVLYKIGNTSFSSASTSSSSFYNLIKAYLGGAPLVDVVALSTQNISMDMDTFRSLEQDVIKGLTVNNVRGIMGSHLQDLKLFENDTLVQTWVNLQLQSDLDTLGLGLISNRIDSTNGTAGTNTTSSVGSGTTVSQATPVNGEMEHTSSPASVFLAVLLTALLQMIQQSSL